MVAAGSPSGMMPTDGGSSLLMVPLLGLLVSFVEHMIVV